MNSNRRVIVLLVALSCSMAAFANIALAERTLIKNICRVKGQERNTLRGLGLVVGLKGTGDGGESLPTMRALARAMELMHNPLGRGEGLAELKNVKNVALVWVSASVPPSGARQGDQIDCEVSAISAKSLDGGRLAFAALQGPNLRDGRIYALAEGRIELDDPQYPLVGSIAGGARMEENVFNAFHQDGVLTLVLDEHHADFQIAAAVAATINSHLGYSGVKDAVTKVEEIAAPLDAANIVVRIPTQYREAPVDFVAQVLDLPLFELQTEARVVINERTGSIVISGDVVIGSVVVTHKNITVDTDAQSPSARFAEVATEPEESPKLRNLIKALNAVKAPPADIIEIIKGIHKNGNLHGKLIIQ